MARRDKTPKSDGALKRASQTLVKEPKRSEKPQRPERAKINGWKLLSIVVRGVFACTIALGVVGVCVALMVYFHRVDVLPVYVKLLVQLMCVIGIIASAVLQRVYIGELVLEHRLTQQQAAEATSE